MRLRDNLFDAARSFAVGPRAGASVWRWIAASPRRHRHGGDRHGALRHIAVGDHVMISPSGREARVRSIHAQNRPAQAGRPANAAPSTSPARIRKDAIARGDVVLDPRCMRPPIASTRAARAAKRAEDSQPWTPVRLHHAATDVGARLVPLGEEPIAPGDASWCSLSLERPIAAAVGDSFVAARYLRPKHDRRRTISRPARACTQAPPAERLAQLQAHANHDPQHALAALLGQSPGFVDLSTFARDRALSDSDVERLLDEDVAWFVSPRRGVLAIAPETWSQYLKRASHRSENFHAEIRTYPASALNGFGSSSRRGCRRPRSRRSFKRWRGTGRFL